MTVEYDPDALDELREAIRWYDAKRIGLGEEVAAEIDTSKELIERRPRASLQVNVPWPNVAIRRRIVKRFPYTLYYHIRADGDITIVAVAHQSMRPLYWLHRLTP